MPIIRLDTYSGLLNSVDVLSSYSPYTLLDSISGDSLVEVAAGVYTVDVGDLTGEWIIVLKDSDDETLGTRYASPDYLFGSSEPPWLLDPTGSEDVTITIRSSTSVPVAGAIVNISTNVSGSAIILSNMVSNNDGQIFTKLNPGTYYIWAAHPSHTITNPTTIEVTDV